MDDDGPDTIEELRKYIGTEEQFQQYKNKDVNEEEVKYEILE